MIENGDRYLERFEDVMIHRVIVPIGHATAQGTIKLGGHNLDTGLDQSARQQALLSPTVPAVPITNRSGFLLQVKGIPGLVAD